MVFIHISSTVARMKFYVAWKLSEGACNLCGVGYSGIENGQQVWNRGQNINILGMELPENPKAITEAWNINTSRWLRNYVYFRISDPKKGGSMAFATFATNMTSAFWHGFYPGYYMFFGSASFFILVSRAARRNFRPLFVNTRWSGYKSFYDIAGIVTTSITCCYMMVPFVLKHFDVSFAIWVQLFFYVHVLSLLLLLWFNNFGGSLSLKRFRRTISLDESDKTE